MLYLFFQIWVWLIAAFILGWLAHWFFCCRAKDEKGTQTRVSSSNEVATSGMSSQANNEQWKPQGFTSAPAQVDDLKRIKGVGAVIEETLQGLGIYQFEQIANWTQDNIDWVENSLSFPGRIQRENWIEQAKTLAAGGTTEFAARVDQGDVDYED